MLGKLTWNAIPWDQPIPLAAGAAVFSIAIAVVAWVVLKGHLPYLWREWITSVDHKRIGIMYMILGLIMLVRGFVDAIMMRSQQALAFHAPGYLPPEHYNQIFSAHGTIMIFFAAMPLMIGLMNFAVPLQLGVRDVAFPTLNSTSFWLTATGALLVNLSLVVGEFARTGWLPYPPLSELGRGHADDRHQFRHHHPQDTRARHGLSAHVHVLLDGACRQPADRGGLPDPHRHPRDADA
jgi:cytochrome o ubiquinol oxidase subunit 1